MNNVSTVRIILFRVITIVFFVLPGTCIYIPKAYSQVPAASVYTEQLGFVKENGQFLVFDSLKFHWKNNNVFTYFLPDRVVFITQEINYRDNERSREEAAKGNENLAKKLSAETTARRFDMVFENCNSGVNISGENPEQIQSDYYLGHCPNGILNVASYQQIRYSNLYPGTDLVFRHDGGSLKYFIELSPGADPDKIRLRWDGVENLQQGSNGEIRFSAGTFEFVDAAPVTENGGMQVESSYTLTENTVGFHIDGYNTTEPLVIDPGLFWASSLQYNGYGTWGGVVANSSGQYYVVDWEWSPGGADVAAYLASAGTSTLYSSDATNNDIIISKFSKNGALLWVCRYGGTGDDDVNGAVEMDGNNNLYIAGTSAKNTSLGSGDFPLQTLAGAYNQAWDGSLSVGTRGYLLKFLPDNSRQWATYLDRGANLEVFDIAIGVGNTVYLAGKSGGSPTYITSGSIPSGTGYLGALNGTSSAHNFVMEFNSSGALYWATWLPGNSTSTGRVSDIAVNKSTGEVFLCGDDLWSAAYIFSTALISASMTYMGQDDMFYMKFNSSNQPVPAYGKYFGGAGFDKINIGAMNGDIELDASGNLYVCGHTYSANFPLVNPGTCAYYDGVINDGSGITANVAATQDGFLFKVNSSGAMTLSTFFGGTGYTSMKMLKKDSHNNLWICGMQTAAGLATVSRTGYYNQAIAGASQNILFAQLGTNDNMEWLAYYGFSTGYSDYNGFDIFEPTTDSVYTYLAGNFNYTVNTGSGYQYSVSSSCSGAAQFKNYYAPYCPFTISGSSSICQGNSSTWTASTGGGTWSSSNTGIFTVNSSTGAVTGVSPGTATITYTLTISSCSYSTTASITISAGATPTFTALGPYCIGASPASLPGTSTNGIAGTWSPATISTAAAGTTTYTFTPSVACATTTTMNVTINAPGTATITAGGPTTFCNGGSVVLTASGGTSYQWSTGATTSSITVNASGNYTVSITSGCGSPLSSPVSVVINAPPVAIITGTSTICVGQTSVLSAATSIAGTGTITGYQWWYDNGTTNTAISGATGSTYTASQPGTYSVVITDSNGCTSVACP